MNNSVLKISLVLILAALLTAGVPDTRAADPADSLRAGLSAAGDSLDDLTVERDSLSARLQEQSAAVELLKGSLAASGFSPLDRYRLGERLRASQALADSLDALNMRLAALRLSLDSQRRALYRLCSAEIDSLSQRLDSAHPDKSRLDRIEALRVEREALAGGFAAGPRLVYDPQVVASLQISPQDSPEEVRDKADFAADLSTRFERGLGQLESDIHRVRDESAVRKRIGEFTQDLGLFDEGLAARRAQTRTEIASAGKEIITDASLKHENITGSTVETTPSGLSLDRDLYDPEKEQTLLRNLEFLSSGEIRAVLARLEARRDSLKSDLVALRQIERNLRLQAAGLGTGQEGTGRK